MERYVSKTPMVETLLLENFLLIHICVEYLYKEYS